MMSISTKIDKLEKSHLFNWDWRTFLLVLIASIPIPIVALYNIDLALAMPIGLIPAVFSGVGATRKSRVRVLFLGLLIPVSLMVGALLRQYTNIWIAGLAIVLAAVLAVFMMTKGKMIGLSLVAPIIGLGLSYPDAATILGLFVVMFLESTVVFIVSLFFPKRAVPTDVPPIPKLPIKQAKIFGTLFALGLLTATLVSWGWDHMGWVVGSTGLVMRPALKMQDFRSIWRAVSILAGVCISTAVLFLQIPPVAAAIFSACVMVVCAGISKSRAYIVPLFMTICVFMMLEYPISGVDEAWTWFFQRILEVGLGIAIAWVFGSLVPLIVKTIENRRMKKKS